MTAAADWSDWKQARSSREFGASTSAVDSVTTWQIHCGWQSGQNIHAGWQSGGDSWQSHDADYNVSKSSSHWEDSWHWKEWSWVDGDRSHHSYWDWHEASTDVVADTLQDDSSKDSHLADSTSVDKDDKASLLPARLLGNSKPLILVLGLPKCGTTSLHEAFLSAGFSSVHWALDAGRNSSADKRLRERSENAHSRLIALLMQQAISEKMPPLAYLPHGVDAVAEMNGLTWSIDAHGRKTGEVLGCFPQMSYLEDLLHFYPQAHYILNVRNPSKWVKSVDCHNDMRKRLIVADLPGLPRGCGSCDNELVGWVQSHYDRVKTLLGQRRARLLEFDIEQHGERELSAFLNRKVAWGHHNRTA